MFAIVKKFLRCRDLLKASSKKVDDTYGEHFLCIVWMECMKWVSAFASKQKENFKAASSDDFWPVERRNKTHRNTALIYNQIIKLLWLICKQTFAYYKTSSRHKVTSDCSHVSGHLIVRYFCPPSPEEKVGGRLSFSLTMALIQEVDERTKTRS